MWTCRRRRSACGRRLRRAGGCIRCDPPPRRCAVHGIVIVRVRKPKARLRHAAARASKSAAFKFEVPVRNRCKHGGISNSAKASGFGAVLPPGIKKSTGMFTRCHEPAPPGAEINSQREQEMIRTTLVVAMLAFGATALVAQSDPIAARKALMKANGDQSKIATDMLEAKQPFNLDAVRDVRRGGREGAGTLP